MTNEQFIQTWLTKPTPNLKYRNLSTPANGHILLSYATKIAKRDGNKIFLSTVRYSVTTSAQMRKVSLLAKRSGLDVFAIPVPLDYVENYYDAWYDLAFEIRAQGATEFQLDQCRKFFILVASQPGATPMAVTTSVFEHYLTSLQERVA